jgi:hypothetical protein
MADTIVVAGAVAQLPGRGGHTWVFLQYLLGFQRLGWKVVFVDWIDSSMQGGAGPAPADPSRSAAAEYLRMTMSGFGLGDAYALIDRDTGAIQGMPRSRLLARVKEAAALINVMGYLRDEELLQAARLRVFLDIDPGFPQMWSALGLADPFAGHDLFVTIGLHVGEPSCPIPTCGLRWIKSPQPVVLAQWPPRPVPDAPFATVATWRGANGPIEYDGDIYGLRVHEFRRFLELPRLVDRPFEVALDIDEADAADLARLTGSGWQLVDPRAVAADPWLYRDYVARAGGEFAVAKNMYVRTAGGWFSDRSICFLATGRPVVAQDTGIRDLYPTGEGLLAFSDADEARAALQEVAAAPARHSRAARELAEEHFDSDKVLSVLLSRLGIA